MGLSLAAMDRVQRCLGRGSVEPCFFDLQHARCQLVAYKRRGLGAEFGLRFFLYEHFGRSFPCYFCLYKRKYAF